MPSLILSMSAGMMMFLVSVHQVWALDVWVDTDPACGHGYTRDIDDCLALTQALSTPKLDIKGISTVFGNDSGDVSFSTAKNVIEQLNEFGVRYPSKNVFRGADKPLSKSDDITPAVIAMRDALLAQPLHVIALGPVTNIAVLLEQFPQVHARIRSVIAVAGQRPSADLGFYPAADSLMHVHDMNFRKDVKAFDALLASGIPVTLVPYEASSKIRLSSQDLLSIHEKPEVGQWLSDMSREWQGFWDTAFGIKGFFPFDLLAVIYAENPAAMQCEMLPVRIRYQRSLFRQSRDFLEVSSSFNTQRYANYCWGQTSHFPRVTYN